MAVLFFNSNVNINKLNYKRRVNYPRVFTVNWYQLKHDNDKPVLNTFSLYKSGLKYRFHYFHIIMLNYQLYCCGT